MRIRQAFVIAGIGALLSACQTTSDPTQGGLFGGIGGLASGSYDQRVQDRQQNLENEQDNNVALAREKQRVDQQGSATRAKLTRLEEEYATLSGDIKAMEKQLASAKDQNSDLKSRLDQLQKQVDLVQSDPFASEAIKKQRLEELRRQQQLLQDEVNAALGS